MKVTWPTRKETYASTVVVIVTVASPPSSCAGFDLDLGLTRQPGDALTGRGDCCNGDEMVRGPHLLGHENKAKLVADGARAPGGLNEQFGEILIPMDTSSSW